MTTDRTRLAPEDAIYLGSPPHKYGEGRLRNGNNGYANGNGNLIVNTNGGGGSGTNTRDGSRTRRGRTKDGKERGSRSRGRKAAWKKLLWVKQSCMSLHILYSLVEAICLGSVDVDENLLLTTYS